MTQGQYKAGAQIIPRYGFNVFRDRPHMSQPIASLSHHRHLRIRRLKNRRTSGEELHRIILIQRCNDLLESLSKVELLLRRSRPFLGLSFLSQHIGKKRINDLTELIHEIDELLVKE